MSDGYVQDLEGESYAELFGVRISGFDSDRIWYFPDRSHKPPSQHFYLTKLDRPRRRSKADLHTVDVIPKHHQIHLPRFVEPFD